MSARLLPILAGALLLCGCEKQETHANARIAACGVLDLTVEDADGTFRQYYLGVHGFPCEVWKESERWTIALRKESSFMSRWEIVFARKEAAK